MYDIGYFILENDKADIGQMNRIHHYHLGSFMMFLGGLAGSVANATSKAQVLNQPRGYLGR